VKKLIFLSLFFSFSFNSFADEFPVQDYFKLENSSQYRFIDNLLKANYKLSKNSSKWLERWKGLNLEEVENFRFDELSGSSSINLKIKKIDSQDEKGYKSLGTFVTENEAANPNTEVAYFQLALILKVDHMVRPSLRYQLSNNAKDEFKKLLEVTSFNGKMRNENKARILKAINKDHDLYGCLKAKKSDSNIAFEYLVQESRFTKKLSLNKKYGFDRYLDAKETPPKKGDRIELLKSYSGDAFELSRELSIMLTLDAVFGQYDRFSGGNVVIEKDSNENAHFVLTDNGGAYVTNSASMIEKTTRLFSRFDRFSIEQLKELQLFLKGEKSEYVGYSNPLKFIFDLGLVTNYSPEAYRKALLLNLAQFLGHVDKNYKQFGESIYF